ncbi:hypothetical protein AR158_c585R [Paramecium bursaria Chlorella virus AR158]|uniref:hypothetical protein n=1 Tax=Paramecium bursaria Chlorella virus AR158 TaxID=380598 RepID=UPI00015AA797|nr:hypothetical protein AR158_c585R [Paramecium bursaria Chlorella virus AR158]ABU44130.1 hypothetical protein AR158_c585R [Paramecium bursaria Chlorella virus AR158]
MFVRTSSPSSTIINNSMFMKNPIQFGSLRIIMVNSSEWFLNIIASLCSCILCSAERSCSLFLTISIVIYFIFFLSF